jgi:hypothetical protein
MAKNLISACLLIPFIACAQFEIDFDDDFSRSATSWTPKTINDCVLWFDASDVNSIILSGTNVVSWADKSATGCFATNGGTATPAYLAGFVNGRSVLNFDGLNDRLLFCKTVSISNNTVFLVFNRISAGTKGQPLGNTVDKTAPSQWYADNALYVSLNNQLAFRSAQTNFGYFVDSILISGGVATNTIYRRNKVVVGLPSRSSYAGAGNTLNTVGYCDGSYNSGAICEIIIYSRVLTANEIETIENYLYGKWK